jgi:hypothetical protein
MGSGGGKRGCNQAAQVTFPANLAMTNIVNLDSTRRKHRQSKADGITLCQSGFHKWQTMAGQRFDVKQGKLVTTERCARCNIERTKLT